MKAHLSSWMRPCLHHLRLHWSQTSSVPVATRACSTAPRVYVTHHVPPRGLHLLREKDYAVTYRDSTEFVPRDELLSNVRGKDALFCIYMNRIDSELLDAAG